jgi:hypothetical protein
MLAWDSNKQLFRRPVRHKCVIYLLYWCSLHYYDVSSIVFKLMMGSKKTPAHPFPRVKEALDCSWIVVSREEYTAAYSQYINVVSRLCYAMLAKKVCLVSRAHALKGYSSRSHTPESRAKHIINITRCITSCPLRESSIIILCNNLQFFVEAGMSATDCTL